MGKFGKKNHVSLNPQDVSVILAAEKKWGKTTLAMEIAEKLSGGKDFTYMFLEMYHELGAEKIEGIIRENVPDWATFEEIVSDIEDNKTTDYPDLKMVFIDTWDNAIQLAEQESIRLWNRANPDKKSDNINSVWSGFQRGQEKAADLLDDMIYRLKSVGINVWILMHVKSKESMDPITGATYQQLTSDVSQKYFGRLKRNTDLIAVGYTDREIAKEILDKKNPVTKKNETRNIIKTESRRIKFRDNGYVVDAGGRLKYIVDEIPMDADAFINAVTDALKAEVENAGVNLKDREKEDAKREKDKLEAVATAESESKQAKEILSKVQDFMKENKTNADARSVLVQLTNYIKDHDYEKFSEIKSLDDANALLDIVNSFNED